MSLTIEPVTRVRVTVTFLRMSHPPATPARPLPADCEVVRILPCSVERYRYLYNTVGAPYVWWLRRTLTDRHLSQHLRDRQVSIHELRRAGSAAGFYELDAGNRPLINLSYFGLMPHAVGHGLGAAFLRHAVDAAWRDGADGVTVNTCTADHPRAMPMYLKAGFKPVREVREDWSVPNRLGLDIPQHVRG